MSDSLSEMASGDLKGYDCDFVDPVPTSLVCLICRLIARAPQQMVCCGKVYCNKGWSHNTCCTDTRDRDQSEIKRSSCKIGDDQAIKTSVCTAQIKVKMGPVL